MFKIINKFNTKLTEFTFECNIDIEEEKLKILKENGVNRISVGIQTINQDLLKIIDRFHTKEEVLNKINLIKKYFNNINIDLMYALPSESLDILKDINKARIFKEYEFSFVSDKKHHGIIDLLIEYENRILIIDYKLNDIENLEYIKQLSSYKEYIKSLNLNKDINMYLFSFLENKIKEI